MSNPTNEIYEFDRFRLDVSERILWSGTERLPLSDKAFDTLCVLIRRGNSLVSRDALLTEIWAGTIVEENNLDKNISILRRVLGPRKDEGIFIETVRGHGFRFVAEISSVGQKERNPEPANFLEVGCETIQGEPPPSSRSHSEPQPHSADLRSHEEHNVEPAQENLNSGNIQTPKSNRARLTAIVCVVLIGASLLSFYFWRNGNMTTVTDAPVKTIAVLPFKSLSAKMRNEALELGMADTLISKLGGGEIIVRPLGSVSRYADLNQDSLIAGRELTVETVLDGTIQTTDNRIRISAQLLRTSDGKQLWAGQFDENYADIFAVQDSISERVTTALKIRLGGGKKRPTENVEAYQLYMKGRFHLLKGVRSETEKSFTYFLQAIEVDPNYALAYAGLSDAYRAQAVGGEMPAGDTMPKAKAAALRAVELDENLAEAHANLGHVYFWYEWDWNAAERQHQRALELDPNSTDALQFYAHLLSSIGRYPEALAKIKRARELDPLNLRVGAIEGMLLHYAGQTEEAVSRLRKTLELDPNHRIALLMSARALSGKGMFTEALAETSKARNLNPMSSEPSAYGSYALAKTGKLDEANAELDEMMKTSAVRYVPSYNIALACNAVGQPEKALDYLEKAFTEKDVRMVWLKVEPNWNNLRNEPRFINLMKKMNFDN